MASSWWLDATHPTTMVPCTLARRLPGRGHPSAERHDVHPRPLSFSTASPSGGETVSTNQLDPVEEHLPDGDPVGTILVVSDYRPLNLGHADALCEAGSAVYTAATCTDVPRLF